MILDSVVLAVIDAPETLGDEPVTVNLTITDPDLFGLDDALFEFRFDGPTGSEILIGNIVLPSVPISNNPPAVAADDNSVTVNEGDISIMSGTYEDIDLGDAVDVTS